MFIPELIVRLSPPPKKKAMEKPLKMK